MRFHDLKHNFATLMLKGGEHPKVVQEMMGHATINITLDTTPTCYRTCRTRQPIG